MLFEHLVWIIYNVVSSAAKHFIRRAMDNRLGQYVERELWSRQRFRTAHHCRADRLGVELARDWKPKPKPERARARQQGLSQR